MKKTILLTAALLSGLFTANAAILVESSWTVAGGAWDAARQTGFSGGNGTLLADADSSSDVSLVVSGGSYANSLFQGAFFYTLFTMPTFTFSADSVDSSVTKLVLEMKAANIQTPLLKFANGDAFSKAYTFAEGASESIPTPIGDQTATVYTYTWDIADFDFSDGFDIVFTTGQHNAFFEITLTQVVPEPSTYAMILGAVVLGGVAIARRRRA